MKACPQRATQRPATTSRSDWKANNIAALVSGEKSNFQFILRLLNTNVDGKQKIMYALTRIKGVGRRYSNLVCKKADIDLNKRYGHAIEDRGSQVLMVLQRW